MAPFFFSPYSTLKSRAQELEAAKSRQERSNNDSNVVKKGTDKEADSGIHAKLVTLT